MAQLTAVRVGKKLPLGDRYLVTVRVTQATGAGVATEWIDKSAFGLNWIDAVVGVAAIGPGAGSPANFVLNVGTGTTGTSGTAGANPGNLAVETVAAVAGDTTSAGLQITVIGKP